ncbi:hypothetical protein [Hydrogenophaga sp. ANAO-22]|uniref:hypothetical protein n=1 Tax=Hydrogenophaga sp. ANAO-22 TaxID=3166645 RepID=UPI0036D379E2
MEQWMQFEIAMRREVFQMIVLGAIASTISFLITMYVLYIVIKNAVRDGINESRLTDNWRGRVAAAKRTTHDGDTLPPMHAD